ncbi:RNA polymerase sigma factor (sigma-70 family) [Dyadobacter sp. BE34]|uniref:RNA polymerase sigma factor (Sigma-70 family) n=1 Tax=Dyadobacter fermentans TaxID=94254 RepID=A0ABU1QVX4_9BACT|nr:MULTISPECIES: sigma-70 family RNA polymerase sigma factor [Dyadobacter]MDR6805312.1 RNA polymerase sigma factor (sigma-70 family) [Dyadobacter fermentans]MDR7042928.1 RNA polymerase sigma factor (sigma-70 family) [Dyadobacter sp. BE242]MDR7197240.1 RNA polymerase sigma factor (sigma-70 family) [Dyadobacter sp. BE34]MDR7215325.1 RNA polymerase sigma factor (sigma-70 family) [Dyadobacter sp. BE31]MDR7262861.1 RNA polymerase sigma factor (sigma-70 family) [Dyadobacter sp. BE32]
MRPRITPDEAQKLWNDYQSGDMYALANIMQGYYSDLFHWGLRLHGEREFVKDCIQDMFVNLWKTQQSAGAAHAGSFGAVSNVRSYLLVVLKTRILRELSKKHVTHQSMLSDEYSFSVEFSSDLRLIDEEHEIYQVRKLEGVLNSLSGRQKELIYLRFYQSLSFEQIAEVMNLSRQSVYNLLQKSLGSLRKHYDLSS